MRQIEGERQRPGRDVVEGGVGEFGAPLEERPDQPVLGLDQNDDVRIFWSEALTARLDRLRQSRDVDVMAPEDVDEVVGTRRVVRVAEDVGTNRILSGFPQGGRKAPAFSGTFEQASAPGEALEKRSYSTEGLRGKVVLVEFWTAAVPGRGKRVKKLAADLAKNLKDYPDLKGKVQALGVNLDTSRELFEAAIAAWGTPWPELHDGQGFRTPLAEAFAIPRVPQWVVIEASGGRVVHIGPDYERFLKAATRELRRVRGLEE